MTVRRRRTKLLHDDRGLGDATEDGLFADPSGDGPCLLYPEGDVAAENVEELSEEPDAEGLPVAHLRAGKGGAPPVAACARGVRTC